MSTNNLYAQLIELARIQNITLSENSTQRSQSESHSTFPSKMKSIKEQIQLIKQNNIKILKMKDKILHTAVPATETQLLNQISQLCDHSYTLIKEVKASLEELATLVKQHATEYPDQPETLAKIYQKQYLMKEVESIIKETQQVQKLIEKYSINTSLHRIKSLSPEITDEEAEQLAKKKNGFDQLVMSKIMGKASLKLKYRVDDIVQKHNQIQHLEKSVEDNLQLMKQIAELVFEQGKQIDNIYQNVLQAKDYVQKAEANLKKEKKEHKKSRKKKCCIILVAIFILALIATPIILKVVNDQNNAT